jgi:hypothetical protein
VSPRLSIPARRDAWVPLASYAGLIALHTVVTWGMWHWRDLTSGDTAYYFDMARKWYTHAGNVITFSPLYTAFYGTFLFFSPDAYAITVAHRLVISLTAALLVLAVARTFLSAPVAWLVAAWWTVLPVNYDTLYEVHLFSVIPVLVVYWLLFTAESSYRRGAALAIMCALPVLVRNEFLLAPVLLIPVFAWWEGWAPADPEWRRKLWRAYGVPIAICGLVLAATYWRSDVKFPELSAAFEDKQTLNACHVFAFGYHQRNPGWNHSPWLECDELMAETFGARRPTMLEAIRANPGAMAEHMAWNASLIPSGLQLLLFSRMAGDITPDYVPVRGGLPWVLAASVVVLLVLAAGWGRLWRDGAGWHALVTRRAQGWAAVLAFMLLGVVVMLTQRPRPSYLFATSVGIMLATGVAVEALARRWIAGHERGWSIAVVVSGLVLAWTVPARPTEAPRPLLEGYRRLQGIADRLEGPGKVLVTLGHGENLCAYLAVGGRPRCRGLHYHALRPEVAAGRPWADVFDSHGVTSVYATEEMTADRILREFVARPRRWGWRVLVRGKSVRGNWVVLERAPA